MNRTAGELDELVALIAASEKTKRNTERASKRKQILSQAMNLILDRAISDYSLVETYFHTVWN
jgi:hypothetical protein